MNVQARPRNATRAARQSGQAMLLTVLLLAVGVVGIIYNLTTPAQFDIESDRQTAAAMAEVRDALIGWSAARTPSMALPNARPGELPCPDTDNDGFEQGNCAAGAIGRVPWKTLGITEPKDGSGETLWYTYSGSFRIWNTNPFPINSDTAGQLTITGVTPAANVIAIIFAPGRVVGAQVRDAANQNNVANYLEGENANGDTVYSTALAAAGFNDKLLPLTSDALFGVVNIRVAREAMNALEAYRTLNLFYPFANAYGTGPPYNCTLDLTRGRFPITPTGCGGAPWGGLLPAWFATNNWNLVTHYAIARPCADLTQLLAVLSPGLRKVVSDLLCGLGETLNNGLLNAVNQQLKINGLPTLEYTGDDYLFVNGVTAANGARALVVLTGRALSVQVHPCATVGNCLEDAENTDGDATYIKPSRYPSSNDRLAVVCDVSTPCPLVP